MGKRIALCILLAGLSGLAWAAPPAVCGELESQGPDLDRLAACGLDEETLRQRQCHKAYDQQNLEFLLRHCQYEAWSLARAQCERNLDSISPRYAAFCRAFGRE